MIENITKGSFFSYIDEYRNLLSLLLLEWCLAYPALKRRHHFKARVGVFLLGMAAFCGICYLQVYASGYRSNVAVRYTFAGIWYAMVVIYSILLINICFELNYIESVWLMLTAYAVQHLLYCVVVELLLYGLLKSRYNYWLLLIIFATAAVMAAWILQKTMAKVMYNGDHLYVRKFTSFSPMFTMFFLIFLFSTFINQHNALSDPEQINYLAAVSDFANCMFVIAVQYVAMYSMKLQYDKQVVENLLEREKLQYDAFQRSVEYINIKAHDLKHELKRIQNSHNLDEDVLTEIEDNIAAYESFAKTGNDSVDIILTDKILLCREKNISFSYMAEAEELARVSESDLYSLFGNMFDNAAEYLDSVDDPENKFIRLFIRKVNRNTVIKLENYLDQAPKPTSDGRFKTSKNDEINHGFGIRSMQTIAKKYGGSLTVSAEDGLFTVTCIIPFDSSRTLD